MPNLPVRRASPREIASMNARASSGCSPQAFRRYASGLLLALGASCSEPPDPPAPAPTPTGPNVLLIVIDTVRADHFSCNEYERRTTPRIDKFARDAVTYRNASSPAPWTLPAHASMFTGLPSGLHGMRWIQTPPDEEGLATGALRPEAQRRLLAERFRQAGYRTLGISNNGWISKTTGLDHGFERFWHIQTEREVIADYLEWPAEHSVPRQLAGLAGGSIALLKRELSSLGSDERFFAFLNLIDPHSPYRAPKGYRFFFEGSTPEHQALRRDWADKHYELATLAGAERPDPELLATLYDQEIRYADDVLGNLFRWLRQHGLYDDALIVVTSDHGEHMGENGRYSHQLSVERELLWVPLIIKYPGNAGAGTVEESSLVSTADVYQTLLATTGDTQAEASPWSQDLQRMDRFARSWTLSEYYYSDAYLAQLEALNPAFDAEPHRTVRRVIHTRQGRTVFAGAERVSGSTEAPELQAYETYVERVEALPVGATSHDDPELLEALRELGYVE